jgi:hypothetical protein
MGNDTIESHRQHDLPKEPAGSAAQLPRHADQLVLRLRRVGSGCWPHRGGAGRDDHIPSGQSPDADAEATPLAAFVRMARDKFREQLGKQRVPGSLVSSGLLEITKLPARTEGNARIAPMRDRGGGPSDCRTGRDLVRR